MLVGGGAVELLTGGAYTTGDLDFAGTTPEKIKRRLADAGFEKRGRHWVHPEGEVFLEFPSDGLDPLEESVDLDIAGRRLRVLAPEAVLVDRLAAWQFWNSSSDAVNAFLVLRAFRGRLDTAKLQQLVEHREVASAWERLFAFDQRFQERDPSANELEEWIETNEF